MHEDFASLRITARELTPSRRPRASWRRRLRAERDDDQRDRDGEGDEVRDTLTRRDATQWCDGGVFDLDDLPTPREAAVIRAVIGLDRRGCPTRLPRPRRTRRFTGRQRSPDGRFMPAACPGVGGR